jgi:hypothetical protein
MGKSLSFKDARPVRAHLLRGKGVGGEITDLRKDIDEAFFTLESSGVGGTVAVYDEGLLVMNSVKQIDFIGADVTAVDSGTPNRVQIFVPPPAYLSHWNKADGSNGNQAVTESISRTTVRIATPSGGEGVPFKVSGWDFTNHPATLSGVAIFTTPASTTGFGGDSTATVDVFDANGIAILESYTTPPLVGNNVHSSLSTFITVAIAAYGADALRFRAKMTVTVDIDSILAAVGLVGGRYHVRVTHTCDSATDGTFHVYAQSDVFYDTNPTTPQVTGVVTIVETGGSIVTKHLSGLEYYTTNSAFTAGALGIDDLNEDSIRVNSNLVWDGTEYGLPALSHSPFGTGAASFAGWTNLNNVTNVSYSLPTWAINQPSYRYIGPTANVVVTPQDPWGAGVAQVTADATVLIDTCAVTSTALHEDFDDEARREDPASFPGVGTWVSTATLIAGQAQVFNGRLIVPSSSTYVRSDGPATPNADWTLYKPDLGGANPDYSALVAPVDYGRRFTQAPGLIPSFTIVFSGTFAAGSALADLVAGNLEVYAYRIAAPGAGHFGAPPGNIWPLRVHESYNGAIWDDGLTVLGSGIREGSSAGNTINCTFGAGMPASVGFYCWVRVLNALTQLDSMTVTFW